MSRYEYQDICYYEDRETKNPIVDSDNSMFQLPFYKDEEYLSVMENYTDFIGDCEWLVRHNPLYNKYIHHVKTVLGINRCQVLGNVEEVDASDKLLEMHHGPILTLFDTCSIITEYLLVNRMKITSFLVADMVIKEHANNNVQVMMLSKTVHQTLSDGNGPFLSTKQAVGDINTFLTKYKDGLLSRPDYIRKINKYIELSKKYDSFDKDLFKLEKNVRRLNENVKFY